MKIAESIISSVALLKKTRKHRQSQLVEARALTTVSRMVRRVFVSVNGRFKVGRTTNPFSADGKIGRTRRICFTIIKSSYKLQLVMNFEQQS